MQARTPNRRTRPIRIPDPMLSPLHLPKRGNRECSPVGRSRDPVVRRAPSGAAPAFSRVTANRISPGDPDGFKDYSWPFVSRMALSAPVPFHRARSAHWPPSLDTDAPLPPNSPGTQRRRDAARVRTAPRVVISAAAVRTRSTIPVAATAPADPRSVIVDDLGSLLGDGRRATKSCPAPAESRPRPPPTCCRYMYGG